MPYHIIKFKLPEEREGLDLVLSAHKMDSFLEEWGRWMRDQWKYDNKDVSVKLTCSQWENLRRKYYEMKSEHGL